MRAQYEHCAAMSTPYHRYVQFPCWPGGAGGPQVPKNFGAARQHPVWMCMAATRPPAQCGAWRRWLDVSGITTTGPAFRSVSRHGHLGTTHLSDRALADIVKRRAAAAGLAGTFAGHSLRAGFATEGYAQGTPELAIMRHGRWRSASVMRGYVEEGSIWNDNAAARLGL